MFLFEVTDTVSSALFCPQTGFSIRLIKHALAFLRIGNHLHASTAQQTNKRVTHGSLLFVKRFRISVYLFF